MRHLIACCDGTWNSAHQSRDGVPTPTNVRIFHNLLAERDSDGNEQVKRYFSGVGAEGSKVSRFVDGAVGNGLSANIMNAYLWLATAYEPGDTISVVGFSRGAFTARSLIAMITQCGLVDPQKAPHSWQVVQKVFEDGYAPGVDDRDPDWSKGLKFHDDFGPPAGLQERTALGRKVLFLGVWDTVGALGVPDSFAVTELFDNPRRYKFHDTRLNRGVRCARHAVALDERRGAFAPTLWTDADGDPVSVRDVAPTDGQNVMQLWFPGVHSDVGGGYPETDLSDGALRWMIEQAADHTALRFDKCADEVEGDPRGVLHNSCVGLYDWQTSEPRSAPRVHRDSTRVHESAITRHLKAPLRQDPYRSSTELEPGKSHTVDVLAHLPWNETGLYLRPGSYDLRAAGEWIDLAEASGPEGLSTASYFRQPAYLIGEMADLVEAGWRNLFNPLANVPLSKRIDTDDDGNEARWMQLIVMVANGGFDDDGKPKPPQFELVGKRREITVEREGYLYAFANDAWGMYGNNRGCVTLTVRRTT